MPTGYRNSDIWPMFNDVRGAGGARLGIKVRLFWPLVPCATPKQDISRGERRTPRREVFEALA